MKVLTGSAMELNHPVYDSRLWLTARNETLSRREFIEDIARTIYDFHRKGGVIVSGDTGRIWPIPDVFEVMGEDGRWLSLYFLEIGGRPKHKPSPATLERRRLIDLRYRIKFPHIAEKFKP